jgi:hypothetical protein
MTTCVVLANHFITITFGKDLQWLLWDWDISRKFFDWSWYSLQFTALLPFYCTAFYAITHRYSKARHYKLFLSNYLFDREVAVIAAQAFLMPAHSIAPVPELKLGSTLKVDPAFSDPMRVRTPDVIEAFP